MPSSDFNICRPAFGAAPRLVNHHFGIGQSESLTFLSGRQNDGGAGSGHTNANGGNIVFDVIHRIQNRQSGRNRTARGINVERNVFFRVFGLQKQQLGNGEIRDMVVNRPAKKNNTLAQEAGINIIRSFTELRFFNNGWDKHSESIADFLFFTNFYKTDRMSTWLTSRGKSISTLIPARL